MLDVKRKFAPIPKYPAIVRHTTFTYPFNGTYMALVRQLMDIRPAYLESLAYMESVTDPDKMGRTVTIEFVYRSPSRTLTNDEVNTMHQAFVNEYDLRYKRSENRVGAY